MPEAGIPKNESPVEAREAESVEVREIDSGPDEIRVRESVSGETSRNDSVSDGERVGESASRWEERLVDDRTRESGEDSRGGTAASEATTSLGIATEEA